MCVGIAWRKFDHGGCANQLHERLQTCVLGDGKQRLVCRLSVDVEDFGVCRSLRGCMIIFVFFPGEMDNMYNVIG